MSCEIKYFERIFLHCDFLKTSEVFLVFKKKNRVILRQKFLPKKLYLGSC